MSQPSTNDRISELISRLGSEASPRPSFGTADRLFDCLYPPWVKPLSEVHWTPVSLAIRAAQLLQLSTRILDLGSGIGKFCTVGAMIHPSTRFFGVEQRLPLIRVAQGIAQRLRLDNVGYFHGAIASVALEAFDGAYMFNPFGEHLLDREPQIDGFKRPPCRRRFNELVATTEKQLETARPRFRVVTYHGFGGDMPTSYERLAREAAGTDFLELWIKRA
ncbi:MAG: class I SAM-dependent methyltransferase [Deltaproteobacteria bacterium]|nr:class I SAM-dependent methyltransferase [Deltaproteobacteria bacterium]